MKVTFGNTVEYKKHGTKSIPLKTPEGEPIILAVKDCLTWGPQKNKFGGYQLPLILEGQDEFLKSLMEVRGSCMRHLTETGILNPDEDHNILKSLYEGGNNVTLYAKVVSDTEMYHESKRDVKINPEKYENKRCNVHAAMSVDSIFISATGTISLQVKVYEVLVLKESKKPPRKRMF